MGPVSEPSSGSLPTVGGELRWATERLRLAGSESSRLDAEVLLGHVLGVDRTVILADPEAVVGDGPREAYREALRRRGLGEPVAYIRGIKEFYGLALSVDARVLIPRPETERLVDLAAEHLRHVLSATPRAIDEPPLRVWDVGTGSGAVAIALTVSLRRRGFGEALRITASDRSGDALRVAMENAVAHGVADLIDFAEGDLLAIAGRPDACAAVVANLPYIPSADLPDLPVAASYEPVEALDGGSDGLALVGRLLSQLSGVLQPAGRALLEIGSGHPSAALDLAATMLPDWPARVEPDLAGMPRVLVIDRPS